MLVGNLFALCARLYSVALVGDNSVLTKVNNTPLVLIVLAGFGYGKPVPFNESRLRSALGVSAVALAGPLANLVLAFVCAIPLRFGGADLLDGAYGTVLQLIVFYNCILAIFNLIPIPPLDGSNVVYGLLPPQQKYTWRSYQQYGPMILLALLFFGAQFLRVIVFGPALFLFRLFTGLNF